jgi:hypothetical protein
MFLRSAAPDTLQGRAIQAVNTRWGEDYLQRAGRESIGLPVCKKKYAPFCFPITNSEEKTGEKEIQVERMYGCKIHQELRKAVIEKHGERDGWEPFGQWSLQKAKELARQETVRLNTREKVASVTAVSLSDGGETDNRVDTEDTSSSSDGSLAFKLGQKKNGIDGSLPLSLVGQKKNALMCMTNGNCTWKVKSAYDDIFYEIHGYTESEAEDNI